MVNKDLHELDRALTARLTVLLDDNASFMPELELNKRGTQNDKPQTVSTIFGRNRMLYLSAY